MKAIFKGKVVTCQDVLNAMSDYDIQYPTNEYDSWLEKQIYKYAILHNGKLYPPKRILSLAAGVPTAEFIATEARRVLRNLDFRLVSKPQTIQD